jgi:hypothetical protein
MVMSRTPKLIPLLLIIALSIGVVAAQAITWTSPTYAFYGAAGTGPIFFASSFECTNGSWGGNLIRFTDFNMAGAGNFGYIGFGGQAGLNTTIQEVVPSDHILMQCVGTGQNFTIYLPTQYVMNVTNAAAWGYNNTTKMLKIDTISGTTSITISFTIGGTTPTVFYIPQWFVDQGGAFFGISSVFTSISSVMAAFVVGFTNSVTYIVSFIGTIITSIYFVAGSIYFWFSRMSLLIIQIVTIIGNILDGSSTVQTGLGNIWTFLNFSAWLDLVPLIAFITWIDSIPVRSRKTGRGQMEIMIGDIQVVMYLVDTVWGWSWTIFNFVFGVVMQFVSLMWSLI